MAIRNDISIDWEVSPRIITVLAPSHEMTMQDLLDTLRFEEAKTENMDDPPIVSASGKEPLGSGVYVGLTVTLLNAKLAFEARPGPDYIVCDAGGGNLVAFDNNDLEINPIQPTAFTQIVKTSSASATISDLEAIQYSSYQNSVWYNIASDNSGVEFPSGTREHPCNNIADCILIANQKGFDTIRLLCDTTLDATAQLANFLIYGRNAILTSLVIEDGADVQNCEFRDCRISGVLDGGNILRNCMVDGISYVNGVIYESALTANVITLGGNQTAMFLDCFSAVPGAANTPNISFGADDTGLAIRNFAGGLKLHDKINSAACSIDMASGQVIVESTCTAGTISVRGISEIFDNSTGTCVVDTTGLIDPKDIIDTRKSITNKRVWDKIDNTITLYDDDGVTVLYVFNTNSDMSEISPQ